MKISKMEYEKLVNRKEVIKDQMAEVETAAALKKAKLEGRLIEINDILSRVKVEEEI